VLISTRGVLGVIFQFYPALPSKDLKACIFPALRMNQIFGVFARLVSHSIIRSALEYRRLCLNI